MKTFTESSTEAQKDGVGDSYTNVRLFNEIDKHEARCTVSEVGQPWEDRWGIPDLQAGLCIPLALGKRKKCNDAPAEQQLTEEEEQFIPSDAVLSQAKERGIPLDDGDAIFGIAFELDPPGVMKRNPTIYLDWQRQKRLERTDNASKATQLADLTANRLKGMSTNDIMNKIMQGIFAEPEETRDRILARMGIDPDGLRELIESETW